MSMDISNINDISRVMTTITGKIICLRNSIISSNYINTKCIHLALNKYFADRLKHLL